MHTGFGGERQLAVPLYCSSEPAVEQEQIAWTHVLIAQMSSRGPDLPPVTAANRGDLQKVAAEPDLRARLDPQCRRLPPVQ